MYARAPSSKSSVHAPRLGCTALSLRKREPPSPRAMLFAAPARRARLHLDIAAEQITHLMSPPPRSRSIIRGSSAELHGSSPPRAQMMRRMCSLESVKPWSSLDRPHDFQARFEVARASSFTRPADAIAARRVGGKSGRRAASSSNPPSRRSGGSRSSPAIATSPPRFAR